jgi:homoserine O-acetyltransferase
VNGATAPYRSSGQADAPLLDFEVPLAGIDSAFGTSTRAAVVGPANAPLLVALGGISGNRFVCGGPGVPSWWPGFAGVGQAADPTVSRILGMDFIADPSGRTAPSPLQQAQAVCAALDELGVERAAAIIGASYGGMVGLSLAQHFPDRVERLVIISADASAHPAATAMRELQRRVVALGIENGGAEEALSIARGIAMMTYRTPGEFEQRFEGGLRDASPLGVTDPGSYLRARGKAFQSVMSPERFLSLSASIDRHQVEPERITTPALLIGADSDQLVPPSQMEKLAARLGGSAELRIRSSLFGHDMFLKEAEEMSALARPFLQRASQ